MKTGKRPRRLEKLVITEVSAVDAAANPGARVVIMKRARPRYAMNGAFSLVRVTDDGEQLTQKRITDADHLAAAKREIQDNKEAVMPLAKEFDMETDIIKSMDDRVTEVVKATGCSDAAAMKAIAESRSLADQTLWREYKLNTAPASTEVGKAVDPDKAARKMAKRADELVAAGVAPSRQAAIAKIAESRDPDDLKLWTRYRQSGATLDNSGPEPVGKMESPFAVLVRTIISSYGVSREVAERWAKQVQAKEPPAAMLGGRVTVA